MAKKGRHHFATEIIHRGLSPQDWLGATHVPIYQSASHAHTTAENLSKTFAGETKDSIYMRLANPTNRILEERLAALEGGRDAIVTSSGMAAVANGCMALLRCGDEFVTGNSLFMSTYLFFANVCKKYNITARFAESTDADAVEGAINEKTRFVFFETVGNPKMDVPDLIRMAEIAKRNDLPLLVDNTVATPYLFRPLEWGANVVFHSTTKYLSGHGNALGGVIIDGGTFSWPETRFADFKPFIERKGELAFLDRVWREHHINFGTTQSPFHAYLTGIGMDTLALRMERHVSNAIKVAHFLQDHPKVRWVNSPGIQSNPSHETAKRQFGGQGFIGMLTFGLRDQASCFQCINNLRLIYHLANLGDCKTLIIHPYSTQYISFDEKTRKALSITPDMLRLSVGIEAAEDICEDLDQALKKTSSP